MKRFFALRRGIKNFRYRKCRISNGTWEYTDDIREAYIVQNPDYKASPYEKLVEVDVTIKEISA